MNPETFQPKLVSELNSSWEPKLLNLKSTKKKTGMRPARKTPKMSDPKRLFNELESETVPKLILGQKNSGNFRSANFGKLAYPLKYKLNP